MSLLDVLDQYGGGYSGSSTQYKKPYGVLQPVSDAGGSDQAASSSHERGVPERVDINKFVPEGFGNSQQPEDTPMPLQALEVAGRAPGFVAERPIALLDRLTQDSEGNSPLDAIGQIGIGDFKPFSFAAEALGNISSLPAALANSSTADALVRGTKEGWSDDQALASGLSQGPYGKKQTMTWGEFKAQAAARGFTAQDIQDLMAGNKSSTDFGDHAMSSDALTEAALRIGSDPTNLLFGVGAISKVGAGTGLLLRSVKAGAALEKPLAPSLAAIAASRGIAAQSTWMGLAHYFGQVGRGVGFVPGGAAALDAAGTGLTVAAKGLNLYKKTAIGLTAGQVGLGVVDRATQGFRGGFLEPLFELNREVWDNQPLSHNSAFMLFSAFHFDPFKGIARVVKAGKDVRYAALGSPIRGDVLKALSEGDRWDGAGSPKAVLSRIGGPDALNNLIVHTHAQMAFERVMKNPVIRASLTHFDSLDEAILANAKLGDMIEGILKDDYKKGSVSGKSTVAQLKKWHAERSGVDNAGVDIPWDGMDAVDRWVEYGSAVAPVSQIFHERGGVVLGLVDNVMAEDLRNMNSALRIAGGETKTVPVAEVRKWISRFPQLLQDEWWAKFNLHELDHTTVPYGKLAGKLNKLAKEAPTAREMTHESAAAEHAAAKSEVSADDPQAPLESPPGAQISVSRMRPQIAKRLGMTNDRVDSVQASRADADIASFEGNMGQVLSDAGIQVDSVDQALGAWEGTLEPSVQLTMSGANLADLRLAGAMAGKAGKQDAVALAVTGARMRELGIEANGHEVRIALPSTSRAQLQAIHDILGREFPGYTINDATGVISILSPGGKRAELADALGRLGPEIEALYPRDLIGDTGIATSVHPAYIEFLTAKKGAGDGSYTEVIREARRSGDPRAEYAGRVEAALAQRRAAPGDAGAGLGSDQAVGRDPGDARTLARDLSVPPAERVGPGRLTEGDAPPATPGYLYHATDEAALREIATTGLYPHGPEFRQGGLAWPDSGTGKRNWYADSPEAAAPYAQNADSVLIRVRRQDAGRVRNSTVSQEPYAAKSVLASQVEVYGGDGAWHPLDHWYAPEVHPELAQAAQETAGAYSSAMPVAPLNKADLAHRIDIEDSAWKGPDHPTNQFRAERGLRALGERLPIEGVPTDPGYVYHVAPAEVLDAIRREGVKPQASANNLSGTPWESEALGRFSWWGTELDTGYLGDVILRARAGLTKVDHEFSGVDRVARKPITPDQLEYLGDDLKWHPLPPRFDPTPDATTAGLRVLEDSRWGTKGVPGDEAALAEQLAGLTEATTLDEASVAKAQEVQGRLEATRLAKGEAKRGEVLWNAKRDAEVSGVIPLHHSLSGMDELSKVELRALEAQIREHYPAYTLQAAPQPAILRADRGELAAQYLKDRTALGDALSTWGPMGRISKTLDWLTTPVRNEALGRAARQAVMQELIPHGAKPKEVDQFLAALEKQAALQTIGPFQVRAFRNGTSLTQQAINKIAAGDPEAAIAPIFGDKTVAAIGRDNFARVLDRASNRFIRTMDERARTGGVRGSLARAVGDMYGGFQKTAVGDTTRLVSKTLYHWFRFVSDPRWWAMNMLEADLIGGAKYGMGATRFTGAHRAEVGPAALAHQFGSQATQDAFEKALGDGNGWLYTRRQGGYISRAFDHERPETVLNILREMDHNDPVITGLKEMSQAEDLAAGRTARTEGEITDQDLAAGIDRMLYSVDQKGARATIVDEAKAILGSDRTVEMMPFLQKVWEANDKTYHDIVQMFHGNPHRTNLERIANSYWLYWPLSYQIKASRWLVNVLGNGAFGRDTKLAGAALYAHYVDLHRQRMATDEAYVKMFEDHPTAWFVAQMMFPITPGDMGVSLSRPVRYAGGKLGVWGDYKSASDPVTAAGAIMSLGPVYTAELMARLGREFFVKPADNLYPTPPSLPR